MSKLFAFRFFRRVIQNIALIAATAFALFTAPGQAAEPGKDHPLVGRYEGSVLKFYQAPKFDEINLFKVPVAPRMDAKPETLPLEGNVSFYYYEVPEGRSTLEVQRNYESSLKAKGFEILSSCSTTNGSCYTDKSETNPIYLASIAEKNGPRWPKLPVNKTVQCESKEARYLLAKREADSGTTHVSIDMCWWYGPANVFVAVVESKAMDTDKIAFVDASAMQKSLDATGRVNLYGIYFDTDKDTLKPESKPTLDEISKLMKGSPQLRLQVVGHTDSTGGDAHNKDLSNRRAASVMRALTQAGIDAKRFTSRGAGAAEPVAPNDNEAGRAKNRRVELVRM